MGGDGKDGYYCTICGGIPPDQVKIKKIVIDGKETGIDRLDWILLDVYRRNFGNDETINDELIKRVRQFNYIPTKKMAEYRAALLREFKMLRPDDIRLMEQQMEKEVEPRA
ncbi:NAC family transcription factor [Methanoregula sp. PtaB.Bin085]|jgi:hypothetical protein|uniref:NAC family transcription factor n=1 Tax=Methanoregula sp. PtaB.Bin085 TaxID=1811680 RepID=UPI0009C43D2F|nr:NAC family transcription factor [Methanoregula sp. PtaB.Bin085]OPX65610.1 MAG: hypothetical protein A4E33_00039 [Methanoregula sp. PtaB.Bin085]